MYDRWSIKTKFFNVLEESWLSVMIMQKFVLSSRGSRCVVLHGKCPFNWTFRGRKQELKVIDLIILLVEGFFCIIVLLLCCTVHSYLLTKDHTFSVKYVSDLEVQLHTVGSWEEYCHCITFVFVKATERDAVGGLENSPVF